MSINPLLISLCREYVEVIDTIAYGLFQGSHALHDLEGERGLLHSQLLSIVNTADYELAERDTVEYARRVVRWARMN